MASKLRAVTDADAPTAPKQKLSLKAAAESSERELLVTMRDNISDAIAAGVPPHTLAPLMRQLLEIDKQIRQIDLRSRQESDASAAGAVDDTFDASAI